MHRGIMRQLAANEAGNALAIFAAALIPLSLMIGSGLDLGVMYMARAKLQNACDAAVLAGRQSMTGVTWTDASQTEAQRFFDFNFPVGTHGVDDVEFSVEQDDTDPKQVNASASGTVPTTLMRLAGVDELDIAVSCDATRDQGHNDVVMVLDVTGSMSDAPSNGGGTKIARLRAAAGGLFRALDDGGDSITRYAIVPYSHTVNVARSLRSQDILRSQEYVNGTYSYRICDTDGRYIWNCRNYTSQSMPTTGFSNNNTKYTQIMSFASSGTRVVDITASAWGLVGNTLGSVDAFRTSGDGCIEERSSISNSSGPIRYATTITQADIDNLATSDSDTRRQFGRYDTGAQRGQTQVGCPSEAQRFATYADETAFNTAINTATARVTGGTYHDVGMLWGIRFMSRTGFFAADNPTERDGVPVNQHIVFMTDGRLDTGGTLYSAHGVENYQGRSQGNGQQRDKHIARFDSACDLAKSMGITVWVIALDVTDTSAVAPCATSESHFYTSDGSDLEEIFSAIGQGIGQTRLTQ